MPVNRPMSDTETKAAKALAAKIIDLARAEGNKLAAGGTDNAAIDVILTSGQILALAGFFLTSGGYEDDRWRRCAALCAGSRGRRRQGLAPTDGRAVYRLLGAKRGHHRDNDKLFEPAVISDEAHAALVAKLRANPSVVEIQNPGQGFILPASRPPAPAPEPLLLPPPPSPAPSPAPTPLAEALERLRGSQL